MQVFIDESGSFTGFHHNSISVVGALCLPDTVMTRVLKKYSKFRGRLPQEKGEVKGRLLDEEQVDKVVMLLARNEALFFVTVLDLGLQSEAEVKAYQQKHGQEMLARVPKFDAAVRLKVAEASSLILKLPSTTGSQIPPLVPR